MTDLVTAALARSSRFQVCERQRLQQIMDEQRLQAVFADPSSAAAVGKVAGVQYVIYGRVLNST